MTLNSIADEPYFATTAQNSGVQKLYSEEKVRGYILLQKEAGRSLRQIASNDFGGCITYGDVQRGIKGEFPKRPHKRSVMGLSALVPVEVCPDCGKAPLARHHCCNGKPHKPRPPRLAIRLDDPHSAARSIRRHMTTDQIAALVRALEE